MLCSTLCNVCKNWCLLKSAKFSFRQDVSGITPSSVVPNITAVWPESNVSELTRVLWCRCDLKNARLRQF